MGASMGYRTTTPIPEVLATKVLSDIKKFTEGYEWWAESITFFDHPNFPGHLCGDTKLFCMLDGETGLAHDSFMAYTDADKIISVLEKVSSIHGVDWAINFEDAEVGRVVSGKQTNELCAHREMLLEFCTMMDVDPKSLDRKTILSQYPDR